MPGPPRPAPGPTVSHETSGIAPGRPVLPSLTTGHQTLNPAFAGREKPGLSCLGSPAHLIVRMVAAWRPARSGGSAARGGYEPGGALEAVVAGQRAVVLARG